MVRDEVAKAQEAEQPNVTVTHTDTGNDPLVPIVPSRGEDEGTQLKERDPKRYELVAEHGRGGLGKVNRARDKDLGRDVAIKEMLCPGGVAEARFVREAMITARLEHPGIVPVHEAGRWPDGTPFYSMKLVSGRPLKHLINAAETQQARMALLPHVIAVADAVAYAHDRGIIHRDLKPSNIIVGDFGETVVIDWGLAKDLRATPTEAPDAGPYRTSSDPAATIEGAVMGSPSYMPPEQARGETVDERADVYALGAVLYHLLTGGPPYGGKDPTEILRCLRAGPPPSPSISAREAPEELRAVTERAMSRDPSDRYPGAREFAAELKRFQAGQLVLSHAYSRWSLLKRWATRHRSILAVAALFTVFLVAFAALAVQRIVRERDVAEYARRSAEQRADEMILVQADSRLETDPSETILWAAKYPLTAVDWPRARNIAADAYSRGVARYILRGHQGSVRSAVFARRAVVSVASDRTVRLWDLEMNTSEVVARDAVSYSKLAGSPDGTRFAYQSSQGMVHIVDRAGRVLSKLAGHEGALLSLEFSPDGRFLYTRDWKTTIRLWRLDARAELLGEWNGTLAAGWMNQNELVLVTSLAESSSSRILAFHAVEKRERFIVNTDGVITSVGSVDSTIIAFGRYDGRVGVIDTAIGVVREFGRHGDLAKVAGGCPGGRIVSASRDGTVKIWTQGGQVTGEYKHAAAAWALTCAGEATVTGSEDGTVVVSHAGRGQRSVMRTGGPIFEPIAVSDDKRWFTTVSGREVRVWSTEAGTPTATWRADKLSAYNIIFKDPVTAVTDGMSGLVVERDLRSGSVKILGDRDNIAFGLALEPELDLLAAANHDGSVDLWSLAGRHTATLQGHVGPARGIAISRSKRLLATAGADKSVRVWSLDGREVQKLTGATNEVSRVQFSATGRYLAALEPGGMVRAWETTTWKVVGSWNPDRGASAMKFAGSQNRLVMSDAIGRLFLWDIDRGEPFLLLKASATITALDVSQDGDVILAATEDSKATVVSLRTMGIRVLDLLDTMAAAALLLDDPSRVALACKNGSLWLWDLTTDNIAVARVASASLMSVAIDPAGTTLATASMDGTAATIRIDDLRWVPKDELKLYRWTSAMTSLIDARASEAREAFPGSR